MPTLAVIVLISYIFYWTASTDGHLIYRFNLIKNIIHLKYVVNDVVSISGFLMNLLFLSVVSINLFVQNN